MNTNSAKKHIIFYILSFQVFRNANIVVNLRKKLSGSILFNWLYIAIPIIMYSLNVINMMKEEVFWSGDTKLLSYVKDFSNSIGLSVLYFVSYFLSSYYSSKVDEWLKLATKEDYYNEIIDTEEKNTEKFVFSIIIGIVLFIVGYIAGYSFYKISLNSGIRIWSFQLNSSERLCYCIFLGLTWYHSLSLLGMAISSGGIIFWSIKDNAILYNYQDFNKNISIIKSVDILISTFSYGLFYIIVSILFILQDNISINYEVYSVFYDDINAFILVLAVLLIVVIAYIPLQELFNFMKKQKQALILDFNNQLGKIAISKEEKDIIIDKRNSIINQSPVETSFANKLFIVLSIIIPLIGVIFQGIELFG